MRRNNLHFHNRKIRLQHCGGVVITTLPSLVRLYHVFIVDGTYDPIVVLL